MDFFSSSNNQTSLIVMKPTDGFFIPIVLRPCGRMIGRDFYELLYHLYKFIVLNKERISHDATVGVADELSQAQIGETLPRRCKAFADGADSILISHSFHSGGLLIGFHATMKSSRGNFSRRAGTYHA